MIKGKYRITSRKNGQIVKQTDWIENLVVSNNNHGLNLFAQRLAGLKVYDLEITQAKIGTGTNPPALSDTDLQTPVLDGILRANQFIDNNEVTLQFFISDLELPDGTYNEFGLFAGDQLFARSIIDPAFTKAPAEDTTVDYLLILESEEVES